MKNLLKKYTQFQQGYTIVELLLVIIVIGILAGLVVVNSSGTLDRTAQENVRTSLMDAQRQMKKFYNKSGEYPNNIPGETRIAPGVSLTMGEGPPSSFCITGESRKKTMKIRQNDAEPVDGYCQGYSGPGDDGDPGGGDPDPDPGGGDPDPDPGGGDPDPDPGGGECTPGLSSGYSSMHTEIMGGMDIKIFPDRNADPNGQRVYSVTTTGGVDPYIYKIEDNGCNPGLMMLPGSVLDDSYPDSWSVVGHEELPILMVMIPPNDPVAISAGLGDSLIIIFINLFGGDNDFFSLCNALTPPNNTKLYFKFVIDDDDNHRAERPFTIGCL